MGPLTGITVVDLSRFVSGPWATQMMADLGADVIKIERPLVGDDTRRWDLAGMGQDNPYYMSVNRNKRSVTINIKDPAGQDLVRRLVGKADVFLENLRFGGLDALGLDYDTLSQVNPRLVYCSGGGFGDSGPDRDRQAFDFTVQAESGLMTLSGVPTDPPIKIGIPISDVITACVAANGIQAGLLQRERTGKGTHVRTSLFEALASTFTHVASDWLIGGVQPARLGNAHPNMVPYQTYRASDGELVVGAATETQWKRFCEILERPDLAQDPRFLENPDRVVHREELNREIETEFLRNTRAYWTDRMVAAGIPSGSVRSLPEALASEQAEAIGLVRESVHPKWGPIGLVRNPLTFDGDRDGQFAPPPTLGEHTDQVLLEKLALTEAEVQALRGRGVI